MIHAEAKELVTGFRARCILTLNGDIKQIGKKDSGTIISIGLSPARRDSDPTTAKSVSFEYFVHAVRPFVFHVGYSYSALADVRFEKVRSLNDTDLFARVKNQNNTDELTAFLSLELYSWGSDGDFGVLASLGTAFNDPGEQLFLGASLRFLGRAFVSVGASTSNVPVGGTEVTDSPGGQQRLLFDLFTEERQWSSFVAISFSVF